jgi:CDP-diglyceride synthetase
MSMDVIPLWGFFGLTIALVMGAVEVGRMFGCNVYRRSKNEKESTANAFVGTVLGLVAFILAFTFGIVTNRYDDRKALVLEEANAIGTAYLRADFMSDPDKGKTKELFREYLDSRIGVVQKRDLTQIMKLLTDAARIQQELWELAVANSSKDTNSVVAALYVDSLNSVLDVHAKRVAVGLQARVPVGIWAVLYMLVFLGMFGVGYQMGISGSKARSWMTPILAVSFSLVLLLIASLDRPTNSFITVSQQPLVDLRNSMESDQALKD